MRKKLKIILFVVFILSILSGCSKTSQGVKLVDINLTNEEYAYVVKKGNYSLVNDFNRFLDEIKENGTFDSIIAKYFEGVGEKQGVSITTSNVVNTAENFVVVTNCPFEPFEYIGTDGLIYGIDIEIAQLYALDAGLNLVVKNIDFDAIFSEVNAGYADIGMAGITTSEDRLALYDFTKPYYQASQKLIVSADNHDFDGCVTVSDVEDVLNSLKKANIGFQIGTTGNWYVAGDDDWGYPGFANVNPKGYKTAQLAIQDIINGQLYAVVVDEAPGESMVSAINSDKLSWDIFIDSVTQEENVKLILIGLRNTVLIAILGLFIGIFIGTIIAIIKVRPKTNKTLKFFDRLFSFYVAVFRGTPMVVQLLIAYFVILPIIGIKLEPLLVGILVFGFNSGAYVSEIMRGGINSIDPGQLEAARALGLSHHKAMVKIIIPQAIKNILPTLGNEFITLIKETSVVSFITIIDLYTAFNTIGTNNYSVIIPYIVMAIIYIVLVLLITLLIKIIEKRLSKSDRDN